MISPQSGKGKLISQAEIACVVIVGLLIWVLLTYFLFFSQIRNQSGDTAFVAQVLYNFKKTFRMETTYYTTTTESIDHVWYKSASEVCSMDLETKFKRTPWGHHYLVAYLLLPMAKVMKIPWLIALIHSGVYTSVLIFAYILARLKRINIPIAIALVLLTTQHPLWNQGLIGQLYFNRLFLPFCGLLILLLERNKTNYFNIFIVALLAASTNEIYGITIFIIMISYLFVHKKIDFKILLLSFSFLGFGLISTMYIQRNFPLMSTQTGSLGSLFGNGLSGLIQSLAINVSNYKTHALVIINTIAIGIFTLSKLNLVIPFILLLLPNILVDIGGAEKIGWATHYHIGYFVPIIWISIIGLSYLNRKPKSQGMLVMACFIIMTIINPSTLKMYDKPNIVIKNVSQSLNYYFKNKQFELNFRQQLQSGISSDETLSIPEAISYHFYDHTMYYYPMGIDSVSTVILRYDGAKSGNSRFSSINYGHQDPNLDTCILDRMERGGFDLTNPTIVGDWAILKRQK